MEIASAEEMALAHASAKQSEADSRLYVRFFMGAIEDEAESAKQGRPIFRDVPFVEIGIPGDKNTIIKTRAWVDERNPKSHLRRFPQQWAAFKANASQEAVSGTPIEKLPGITEGQVQELKHFRVRTVEHLAEMADAVGQGFMGFQGLKQRARAWLEAAAGNAPMEAMRAELAKRDAMLAEMQQQLATLSAAQAEPPKRGPGRPPKE